MMVSVPGAEPTDKEAESQRISNEGKQVHAGHFSERGGPDDSMTSLSLASIRQDPEDKICSRQRIRPVPAANSTG